MTFQGQLKIQNQGQTQKVRFLTVLVFFLYRTNATNNKISHVYFIQLDD